MWSLLEGYASKVNQKTKTKDQKLYANIPGISSICYLRKLFILINKQKNCLPIIGVPIFFSYCLSSLAPTVFAIFLL